MASDGSFIGGLPPEKADFVLDLVDYLIVERHPPLIEDCTQDPDGNGLYIPQSIVVNITVADDDGLSLELDRNRLARDDEELTGVGLLRMKIIDLLGEGGCDLFELDMRIRDRNLGQILEVLNWMVERGEVIRSDDRVELNSPARPGLQQRVLWWVKA